MANDPELPLAGAHQTAEVGREGFEELCRRQEAGGIRMTGLRSPGKSDRWLWRVNYELLKTPQ
jgi:hypothetical protein